MAAPFLPENRPPMRILITCTRLNVRAGTQMFVRDLARHLERLGHSVFGFGSNRADSEQLLEDDVIPFVTELEKLPFEPDIIHGQHHLDTMTALTWLPGVPALYHSHGAIWTECPPKHPRIHHYLAMSQTLAQRLSAESNIAPSDLTVFLNPVDLARFAVVRELPVRPARALFFNSRHEHGSDAVRAIREATTRCGIALEHIGPPFTPTVAAPEKVLPSYDIVFASGRSAIEALAAGCAVVVLGRTSCGDLVLPANFDHFRQVNFSIPVNSPPPSADRIEAELRRYAAPECALVSRRLRSEADMDPAVRQLVGIYERVIESHRDAKPDLAGEMLALARYLQKIVPLIKVTDAMLGQAWISATRAGSIEELCAKVTTLEQRLAELERARIPPG
jgi:hypothetical protein